jgi:hypothetical protein
MHVALAVASSQRTSRPRLGARRVCGHMEVRQQPNEYYNGLGAGKRPYDI